MSLLPDGSRESETKRDGFLSTRPEWHALAIGAFFGLVAGFTQSVVAFGFAFVVISGKVKVSNSHLRDAAKEAAYAGGAFVVFFVGGASYRILGELLIG